MSKFKTSIPVDFESIKQLLPEGAHFAGVEWDEAQSDVNILWEDDRLVTGLDFAVEFPSENLGKGKLPDGVKFNRPARPKAPEPVKLEEPAAPVLSDEQRDEIEFNAGIAIALAGRPAIDCQTDAARKGFAVADPETKLRTDGPTLEEWEKAGKFTPDYPPAGYIRKVAGTPAAPAPAPVPGPETPAALVVPEAEVPTAQITPPATTAEAAPAALAEPTGAVVGTGKLEPVAKRTSRR